MSDIISTILFICLIVCILGVAYNMMMLHRNKWVFEQMMLFGDEAFNRSADQWEKLGCPTPADLAVSYETMLKKFWIWDRERFRLKHLPPSDNGGVPPARQLAILLSEQVARAARQHAPLPGPQEE